MKCEELIRRERNRNLNAAIDIPRHLKTELEEQEQLAYIEPGICERKRNHSQKKPANAGTDSDGEESKGLHECPVSISGPIHRILAFVYPAPNVCSVEQKRSANIG